MSTRKTTIYAFLGVLIVWLLSLVFAPNLVHWLYELEDCTQIQRTGVQAISGLVGQCEADNRAAIGIFGDSYGAVNALFSGLAFAGVLLALHFQAEAARRTTKPFVVPQLSRDIASARVYVKKIEHQRGQVRMLMRVSVPLRNCSAQPALNVLSKVGVDSLKPLGECSIEFPLVADSSADCSMELTFTGNEASSLVALLKGAGARANLSLEYHSVDGVRWVSEVAYLLRVAPERGEDLALLDVAIDGDAAVEGVEWAADTLIDLEFSVVQGSWSYSEG